MATSSVEVVSNALRLIGADPITAFTENSEAARLANAFYAPTLDARLRSHNWNFATRRVALAEVSVAPAFEYAHQFQLPQDPFCLYVRETDLDEAERWEIETYATETATYRVIVTDATSVKIVYIARITDVSLWDLLFAEAMEVECAYKFSYAIRRNAELTAQLYKEKEIAWRTARGRDGQEGKPLRSLLSTSLTDVRSG